jgi:hypothetical protein
MSRYFCLDRYILLIKEKYHKITKFINCFDPRRSIEKTKCNQLELYPHGVIIASNEKNRAIDYS